MENVETNSPRLLAVLLMLGSLMPLSGCRICADCEDLAYPAYGGAWQRTLRNSGRVGSVFDPGGAKASELISRDTPPDPDVLERQRQGERGGKITEPDRDEMSDESREKEFQDKEELEDQLRKKRLDDIQQEQEDELRKKSLEDINVRIVPGQPLPPILK